MTTTNNWKTLLVFACCVSSLVSIIFYYSYDNPFNRIYLISQQPNIENSNIRELALSNLTDTIQRRIHRLQFPADCRKAKKLLCHVPKYGFCSQMHLRGYCLMVAYITNRTLLSPIPMEFNYSPTLGWDGYFMPITHCSTIDIRNRSYSKLTNIDQPDLELLEIDSENFTSSALPPAFPSEYAEILLKYHRYPPLFWIGQFQTYLIRYQPFLEKFVQEKIDKLNFQEPIVGVHIRRTDKLQVEAYTFNVNEYMVHVDAWFNRSESLWPAEDIKRRRIYLSTDEPDVIDETVTGRYPKYEFLFEYPPRRNWANPYTDSTLLDIVTTVHMLARCSYVVCTFSSHVCRLAYELAQVIRSDDFSDRYFSLDALYFFHNQQSRLQTVLEDHSGNETELELRRGDVLEVDLPEFMVEKRVFDGYLRGTNLRTRKHGRYPASKVQEKWRIVDF